MAGAHAQPAQQRGGERDTVFVAGAAPHLTRSAKQRLRVGEATLVGAHFSDVAVGERAVGDVTRASARLRAAAVEVHRLVPASRPVREAAHVVEHRRLAVGGAPAPEDLERAAREPGFGRSADSTSAQSSTWQARPSASSSPAASASAIARRASLTASADRPWRCRRPRASRRRGCVARPLARRRDLRARAARAPTSDRLADLAGALGNARVQPEQVGRTDRIAGHEASGRLQGGGSLVELAGPYERLRERFPHRRDRVGLEVEQLPAASVRR
jgi:hypothetical protein